MSVRSISIINAIEYAFGYRTPIIWVWFTVLFIYFAVIASLANWFNFNSDTIDVYLVTLGRMSPVYSLLYNVLKGIIFAIFTLVQSLIFFFFGVFITAQIDIWEEKYKKEELLLKGSNTLQTPDECPNGGEIDIADEGYVKIKQINGQTIPRYLSDAWGKTFVSRGANNAVIVPFFYLKQLEAAGYSLNYEKTEFVRFDLTKF